MFCWALRLFFSISARPVSFCWYWPRSAWICFIRSMVLGMVITFRVLSAMP
ncbi:hypothetical protein D3C78_1946350 [compost metagenome]